MGRTAAQVKPKIPEADVQSPAKGPKRAPKKSPKSLELKRLRRAAKDPNAPKKGLTAFFIFSADNRQRVKDENKDIKVTEVAKELGRLWADAGADVKAKYQKMAEEDKKRYDEQMKTYRRQ